MLVGTVTEAKAADCCHETIESDEAYTVRGHLGELIQVAEGGGPCHHVGVLVFGCLSEHGQHANLVKRPACTNVCRYFMLAK